MNDATRMADQATYDRAVQHFGQRRIALPTFAELAEPKRIGAARVEGLKSVDADDCRVWLDPELRQILSGIH